MKSPVINYLLLVRFLSVRYRHLPMTLSLLPF